jgi:hypothetical protein
VSAGIAYGSKSVDVIVRSGRGRSAASRRLPDFLHDAARAVGQHDAVPRQMRRDGVLKHVDDFRIELEPAAADDELVAGVRGPRAAVRPIRSQGGGDRARTSEDSGVDTSGTNRPGVASKRARRAGSNFSRRSTTGRSQAASRASSRVRNVERRRCRPRALPRLATASAGCATCSAGPTRSPDESEWAQLPRERGQARARKPIHT